MFLSSSKIGLNGFAVEQFKVGLAAVLAVAAKAGDFLQPAGRLQVFGYFQGGGYVANDLSDLSGQHHRLSEQAVQQFKRFGAFDQYGPVCFARRNDVSGCVRCGSGRLADSACKLASHRPLQSAN